MSCFYPSLLFGLIFSLLAGCQGAGESRLFAAADTPEASSRLSRLAQWQAVLAQFEDLDSLPVQVSTKVGEWEGPESKKFRWRGRPLPEKYGLLFDALLPVEAHYGGDAFYANKKFRVDHHTLALLTRVPGEYWASQVYLFLLDTRSWRLTQAYRVAEAWADAGDAFYLETLISRPAPGLFRLESRQGECHPRDESYQQFHCADSLTVGLLQNGHLRLLPKKPAPKR